jgi:AcrR family transcriptional regulator
MPKVTEEHRQARRDLILDAAYKCFLLNGFHRTSMKDICREAGVSVGAVYLHFKSKDEIIEAIWKMTQEARVDRFDSAMQSSSVMQAMAVISAQFSRKLGQPDADRAWQLYVQLLAESSRNPQVREQVRQGWDLMGKQFALAVQRGKARGEFATTTDPYNIGRLWAAVHDGLVLQKIIDPQQDVCKVYGLFEKLMLNSGEKNSSVENR